jgi:hypothetical protein
LTELDLREAGYTRIELPRKQISPFGLQEIPFTKRVYTYITDQVSLPSLEYPITQSDIDAILTGCLRDYGEGFARAVVETTNGWEGPWINDRQKPRYPWSPHDGQYTSIIDRILRELTPITAI